MKKNLVVILLALICVACCALCLTACNPDNGGGEKTLTGLVIVGEDNVEHFGTYYMGEITYLSAPDLSLLALYAKYSDGSKTELTVADEGVNVSYTYNGEAISELPSQYSVGTYLMTITYQGNSVSVQFTIVTSANATPYSITLDKTTWKYTELPIATVTENSVAVADYSVYCITKAKYDEIRKADDFAEKLSQNSEQLMVTVKPDSYYVFAYVHKAGGPYNSNFVSVTITKGDVTPSAVDGALNAQYQYGSKPYATGKITFADIDTSNISGLPTFTDANGVSVEGSWEWVTPTRQVDSTNSGATGVIKFVPTESDCYNEYNLSSNPVTITIKKGAVDKPYFSGQMTSCEITYDGEDHEIKLAIYDSYLDFFNAVVTTKRFSDVIAGGVGTDGLLGARREIGRDRYWFELKDTTNYYWRNDDPEGDYFDETDVESKSLDFNVVAKESWITLVNGSMNIDENRQVRIKIEPGTDGSVNNATPYLAGTLSVEVLESYTNPMGGSRSTTISATASVENDGEYDWVVITVNAFTNTGGEPGWVVIKLSAEGADYYADIDQTWIDLQIDKYIIEYPIEFGATIQATAGTTVEEFYNLYPTLRSNIGNWALYMKQGGSWVKLEDAAALPSGTLECKLVFETEYEEFLAISPSDIEFTLEGIAE